MSIPRQFLITVEMGKATELGQSVRFKHSRARHGF